jgi:hypothetical protein
MTRFNYFSATQATTPNGVAKPLFIVKPQYSKEQAAKIFGFSLGTLKALIAEERITAIQVGQRDFITLDGLLQFMSTRFSQGGVQ